MEFNFKSYEQIADKVANRVLDEFEFNGKTIRAWAETLTCPKTNADRIRAMTDEELADWLFVAWHQSWYTRQEWLDWLRQEAE